MKKYLYILILTTSLFCTSLFSQWVQQTVPVSKPITGIKFIDASTGWACTGTFNILDTGYILNTTNGGINWNIQVRVPSIKFVDIDFINPNTGYIAGNKNDSARAKLFTTTNGGINWSFINMIPNMSIDDIQFFNKDSAWECGVSAGADVRTTTDGGNTWIVRTNGIASATQRLFFLNYTTGFVGAGSNLYKTTNAGMNWLLNNNFSQGVFSIFFININTGWCGLGLNRMYYTSNGGVNWIQQSLPPNSNSTVSDIQFINSNTGYAGTSFDKVFKTTDGGFTWGYQIDTGGSFRISMINDTGWTCSQGAKIDKTTNGGGTIIYSGISNISTEIPNTYQLFQNYPNPFNPLTTIKVDISKSSHAKFIVFDVLGKELYKEEEYLISGSYEFKWDASQYSSGIYFYRLTTDYYTETKKMMLVK